MNENYNILNKKREKKSKFIAAIMSCLYDIKAYNLPSTCVNYGLEAGEESEAYSSKNNYIRRRIENKELDELIVLSRKILQDYFCLELENLILLEEEVSLNKKIKNLTLLDLFDYFNQVKLYGRLTPEDFLLKIKELHLFNQTEMMNLVPESLILQKRDGKLRWYYDDLSKGWQFLENSGLLNQVLELNKLSQSKIFSFIEFIASPEVRRKEEVISLSEKINEIIEKDGFALRRIDNNSTEIIFKIQDISSKIISQNFDVKLNSTQEISSQFIKEHIDDCKKHIEQEKYYDAISEARSLLENVFEYILDKFHIDYNKCNGNLGKLFKEIKKALNFEVENLKTKVKDPSLQDAFIKISGSLEQIVMSIGTISNKMSKRHSRSSIALKHHALLTVNCSYTVCNFIFDTYEFQKNKKC